MADRNDHLWNSWFQKLSANAMDFSIIFSEAEKKPHQILLSFKAGLNSMK
jgi:hypothetical protein